MPFLLRGEKMFITGNLNFSDNQEYNQKIIDNWNNVVKEDDKVYVFGYVGKSKKMKELISSLKGNKIMANWNKNSHYCKERWLNYGFENCWDVNFLYEVGDISCFFPLNFPCEDNSTYILTCGGEDVWGNPNIIYIDTKYWNYTPLNLEDIIVEINKVKNLKRNRRN
jgi:calcineurin-like phosphoesterase family protein